MPYKDPENQRAAQRRHYERNKARMKIRAGEHRQSQRAMLAQYIRDAKADTPCADCGVIYPYYVKDFDHVDGEKECNLSAMANRAVSLERVRAEIAKCEVVCANCHRERTFVQGQALVG